jgi:hypothetical protein
VRRKCSYEVEIVDIRELQEQAKFCWKGSGEEMTGSVSWLGPGAMRIGCKNTCGPNKANQFTPQETQLRDSVCLLEEYCSRVDPISNLDSAQRSTSNN